jgi:predicted phosphoribosyltransferase
MQYQFRDRYDAGRQLAAYLSGYAGRADVLVLALPRGGVPVGYEVARALHAPLDVLLVRKLGVPGQGELAMGAIASGGVRVLNQEVVADFDIPGQVIDAVAACELRELARRERVYRGNRPAPRVCGRTVILIDDGLATGMTMIAAIAAVRRHAPAQVVVAVPVIARESRADVAAAADALTWVVAPARFVAVGRWYGDFAPTTDAEVCGLLADAARMLDPAPPASQRDALENASGVPANEGDANVSLNTGPA